MKSGRRYGEGGNLLACIIALLPIMDCSEPAFCKMLWPHINASIPSYAMTNYRAMHEIYMHLVQIKTLQDIMRSLILNVNKQFIPSLLLLKMSILS